MGYRCLHEKSAGVMYFVLCHSILRRCISQLSKPPMYLFSSMPLYSTKMHFSTSATASVFIIYYSILKRYIFNMLILYFFYVICHKAIYFSTFSAASVFFLCYSIHKDILGLPCCTSRDSPHLTGFATLKVQQD